MSRSITFIAPVESMRGNLSGSQNLVYPTNDNKAYQAPVGRSYARNYKTRYIGALRSRDGKAFFAVKQRSATLINSSTKLNMALLGATQSIIAVLKNDSAFMLKMVASLAAAKAQGFVEDSATVEKYMRDKIRTALASKSQMFSWTQSAAGTPVCTNPFVYVLGAGADVKVVELSNKILREFWSVLATSPIEFKVNTLRGIAHSGQTFNGVCAVGSKINILGLSNVGPKIVMGDSITSEGATLYPIVATLEIVEGEEVYTDVQGTDVIAADGLYYTHYGTIS